MHDSKIRSYTKPHGIGTNQNFEHIRKTELSKFLYINRAPLNEKLIKG